MGFRREGCHLLLRLHHVTAAASLFGASHVSLPLEDARDETSVFLRFRTGRSDAILFLAAGPDDYCLLALEAGALKVRIELGAGEATLFSSKGLRLDDQIWHQVALERRGTEVILLVDQLHETQTTLPGHFMQLDVKWGIFVGGLGDFDDIFLGHMENFRGCIADVMFNDVDVMEMASSSPEASLDVTWGVCSEEFLATHDRAISLIDSDAFVAFPCLSARTGGGISLELRTQSEFALVLYNAGPAAMDDFVALEIVEGRPIASINQGNGVVSVESKRTVSDGSWHRVSLHFSPTHIELTVDDSSETLRTGLGHNQFFDLSGLLYMGGVDLNGRSRAINQHGLQVETSLEGCLRSIHVNDVLRGLPDVRVTRGILPDCQWEYPCQRSPCVPPAHCTQHGLDGFRCICDGQDVCVRDNSTSLMPPPREVLALTPLHVAEGGSDLVSTEHIRVQLDYNEYGVSDFGVLFHVLDPPKHGILEIEVWHRDVADSVFTLADLATNKVRYTHDGSEEHRDSAALELEFRSRSFRLPAFLEERYQFLLHIVISPVNDAPRVKVAPGKVLRLAKGTKKVLTADLLETADDDTSPSELVYTVLNLGEPDVHGYLEHSNAIGKSIETFTQEDIDNRHISYVHQGETEGRLALRVSDGVEAGQTVVLRVKAFDLTLSMINNTGVILAHGAYSVISTWNLSFVTNAPDQNLEIRFEVTDAPHQGSVQRLKSNGRWMAVTHFTQRHINRGKLRYVHTMGGRPEGDLFRFSTSCSGVQAVGAPFEFLISFRSLLLQVLQNHELTIDGLLEGIVDAEHLSYGTEPLPTPPDAIVYTLEQAPHFGSLTLSHREGSEALHVGDQFTQLDIDNHKLVYKLHRRSYATLADEFRFRVEIPGGAVVLREQAFKVCHVPRDSTAVILNEKMTLLEGEETPVTKLHVLLEESSHVTFNVTNAPKHGELRLLDKDLKEVVSRSPTSFTAEDVSAKRLVYRHDDSENDRDSFDFIAYETGSNEDRVYHGTFHVSIIMKNDNPPVRIVDRVFHVVAGSERPLTAKDLKYEDADLGSKPSDIQYTRRTIPNGMLFHADNMNVQVYQFTQEDIDKEKIVFRHSGPEYSRAVLWITDGQYYASGVLEIQASKPFLKISRNTGLLVRGGETAQLSSANLSVETNVQASLESLAYKVTSHPRHGVVLVHGREARQFSQADLDSQAVEYESEDHPEMTGGYQDAFQFIAYLGDTISAPGTFIFSVYPDSFWEPLQVLQNKTLFVDEGSTATVDATILEVTHPDVDPGNITFTVTELPLHGQLQLQERLCSTFAQSQISAGLLRYVHTDKNGSRDTILFDVTNGITTVSSLGLSIRVVPQVLLLQAGNITVAEGGQTVLTSSAVSMGLFGELLSELLVIEPPKHGQLSATAFAPSALAAGVLHYQHDGSETSRDWFTLVARGPGARESLPATVHIKVDPVNDEAPYVANNTGLDLWEGAVAVISAKHLAALDDDSQPEELTFTISTPSNGYVALNNDSRSPILTFTQEMINRAVVLFVHTGSAAGGFKFQVSDGVNKDSPHIFTVNARHLEITLEHNKTLSVLPRTQQSITRDHLLATCSDHSREVTYVVVRPPRLGRLLRENKDGSLTPLARFTQADVDNYLVLYEHTEHMSGVDAQDSIFLDVETVNATPLKGVTFGIRITLGDLGSRSLDSLVRLETPIVEEGGVVAVDTIDVSSLLDLWQGRDDFAKRLRICVTSMPSRGWLQLNGDNYTGCCSPEVLKQGRLLYTHDGSDTMEDLFGVGIYIAGANGQPEVSIYNGTVRIQVLPVNDQPFHLTTPKPRIEVVRGYRTLLMRNDVFTEDLDDVPSDLVYELDKRPNHIHFTVLNQVRVHNFTQKDIDDNNVYVVHDGSTNSDAVELFVGDGVHGVSHFVLQVDIVPVQIEVVNASTLTIIQGSTSAVMSPEVIGVWTNGDRDTLVYNVTSPPKRGSLVFNDRGTVNLFVQRDIDDGLVTYEQDDLSVADDSFVLCISNAPDAVLVGHVVNVSVRALVRQRMLVLQPGLSALITADFLDASKLAAQTNSNPRYEITHPPHLGSIRRADKRTQRAVTYTQVTSFSHEDVINETISYKSQLRLTQDTEDSFDYLLYAPGVQPGQGRFSITLTPPRRPPSTTAATKEQQTSTARPTGPTVVEPGPLLLTNEHLLAIAAGAGVLLLAVLAVVVLLLCGAKRSKTPKKREPQPQRAVLMDDVPASTPPAVPPTSPSSTSSEQRDFDSLPPPYAGVEISPAVPTCKVTPLGREAAAYGLPSSDATSESEEWNDHAGGFAAPPTTVLRKNQYWV
ncbi:chondroitin sulfate proteoglycan 4-like isoform X3 [Ornithodoros turicata]|uniref:chondroitin sulfate proteoglycan 4-like isoform X3 n=1 Tax=Ornithodoros turicata TaxID=34597 RepID=UPI003139891F